ncbi:hypothetical protein [Humisphaera borealis]|uniref:Uncharacterized protein n=1 Tax=Humisphaera borealis TaxID=2807512 RepID=A0A7M2WPF4_9BACT|nr:hypothetical protein [Humisphaera borealis]QOV87405.1 hypothetical protein IPV69_14005 [Humisphaera borealis]
MDYSLTERKIPIGLIIGGELLFVVAGLIQFGSKVGLLLAYVGISTVVGTLLMLMAAYVTAAICKVSFGDLLSAALKLAGIYIFSAALGAFLPSGFGFLVRTTTFVILMMWLFDLELTYVIAFTAVNFVVSLLATFAIAAVLVESGAVTR